MKRKSKLSLITLHSVRNYGSVLQTLASQTILSQHNFSVEVIDYYKAGTRSSDLVRGWADRSGKPYWLVNLILSPTVKRWNSVFNSFLLKNINLSKNKYYSEDDFKRNPIKADAYCVGSDQVWNTDLNNGILSPFFLTFAPKNAYKFSLSSSFGKEKLASNEKKIIKNYLNSFNLITVREQQAVTISEDLGIEGAQHVLDPTLALSGNFWRSKSAAKIIKKPYLLVYQLNANKAFDDYAKKLANKLGLKLVRLCTRYDQITKSGKAVLIPEVQEFISLFQFASFVLTDSFHGTGFCINLNTPFLSVYPENFSSRIASVLDLTGLQSRHLTSFDNYNIAFQSVDFSYANKVLSSERTNLNNLLAECANKVRGKQ